MFFMEMFEKNCAATIAQEMYKIWNLCKMHRFHIFYISEVIDILVTIACLMFVWINE